MVARTGYFGGTDHAIDGLYMEKFRVFNEIGDRLQEVSFEGKTPLDNLAVVSVIHSMFSGLPLVGMLEYTLNGHQGYQRTHVTEHIHLICDGDAPNLKYSQFGTDDPSLAMPLIPHAAAGYEMARNHGISMERIEELEREIMEDYLHICQQVAGEMERYWHKQPDEQLARRYRALRISSITASRNRGNHLFPAPRFVE
uniref:Uncharacterized protein n=1 Tax=Candidatus Kentrum sp. FW TaxID=2126338 RepID=A0A450U202_9GAMM|nr:MAG: hypothetical protein BECKFW1821C_GA0114237_11083 [Candidatus Kentron sp. FW]